MARFAVVMLICTCAHYASALIGDGLRSNQIYQGKHWSELSKPLKPHFAPGLKRTTLNKKRNYGRESWRDEEPKNHVNSVLPREEELSEVNSLDGFPERPESLNIGWKSCSAKNREAYLCSDVDLRCEFWVPLGSSVSWYKDGVLKTRYDHHEFEDQSLITAEDFPDSSSVPLEYAARARYEFHLMSLFYIDCFGPKDQGLYEIKIETPNGKNHSRYFNMEFSGFDPKYFGKCWECKDRETFVPRISDFSKTVIGKSGVDTYLPCRPNIKSALNVVWNKYDRETMKEVDLDPQRFSITDEGDLKISETKLSDAGMYSCELQHYNYNITYDEISTFLKVIN